MPNQIIYNYPIHICGLLRISNKSTSYVRCISVYRRVEKTSVYEVVLQLYDEAWVPGLQDPDNLVHQNMTDQMLHLVSLRIT